MENELKNGNYKKCPQCGEQMRCDLVLPVDGVPAQISTIWLCDYCNNRVESFENFTMPKSNIRNFESGAVRDTVEGKPAMELLPMDLFFLRLAPWFELGAKKYGAHNWRLGQPQSVVIASLLRHLAKYMMGDKSEDHASAIVWNALSLLNVDEYFSDDPYLRDAAKGIPTKELKSSKNLVDKYLKNT